MVIEGRIQDFDREFYGQVEINPDTGLIERVGQRLGEPGLKLQKALILPGFVDVHVHAREDISGREVYKEDYQTASQAALNGGVVAFADMPNNPLPPITEDIYRTKQTLAAKSAVTVVLYAALGLHTRPLSFSVPYKAFMGPSVGDLFFTSRAELAEASGRYRGQNVSFHCEDPEVLKRSETNRTHEERHPREAELEAIDFALELIAKYELVGKICHLTTAEGLEKIKAAKQRGLKVTAEVTPHHLYFDEGMLNARNAKNLQVNPPLRTAGDREALLEALRRGEIDYLASDHAPHTEDEKAKGISGVPGLDTYGALVSWLLKEKNFSAADVIRCTSRQPAAFLNPFLPAEYGKGYGQIAEGFVGSFAVLDLTLPRRISADYLKTKCGWTPYEGLTFPGRVSHTIVRGKIYANA